MMKTLDRPEIFQKDFQNFFQEKIKKDASMLLVTDFATVS